MSFEKKHLDSSLKDMDSKKISYSTLKYFWQAGPFGSDTTDNIPRFLKNLKFLSNFSDYELKKLSSFFHLRQFSPGEIVFEQDDTGFGFYIVLSGHVEVLASRNILEDNELPNPDTKNKQENDLLIQVASLEKNDYFGELALIQENSYRTATAICRDHTVLLGLFRPDLDELLDENPKIGAKLLKSIAMIMANRLTAVTSEIKSLKYRLGLWEKNVSEKKY